jgi:DNA-binding transcriptional MocR family regulator
MALYEDVASRMQDLVESDTWRAGQRLPSVRDLHRDWGVSINTVVEAYRLLEDRGVLEARPQSGHYVRPRLRAPAPVTKRHGRGLDVADLMVRVTMRAGVEGRVGLGCGLPDPAHLPLKELDRVTARVLRDSRLAHAYIHSPGLERLRRALCRKLMVAGCALAPADLVITAGCQEALDLCFRVLCRPGDAVAVESPCFFGQVEILRAQGLVAVEVPCDPTTGLELDALAEVLPRVKAVATSPNYNNPLGSLMPEAHKRRLVAMCARAGVPVVEDDAYGDLGFEGERPPSLKAFDDADHVLSCGTLSKTLSPGLRIGWVAGGRWTGDIARRKMVSTLACASLPQLAAAEFLESGSYERHLRRLRRGYREHVERARAAVSRHFPEGTGVSRPRGGQFVWVQLPRGDALSLFERAWDEGISISPGPMFSASGAHARCLRLNATGVGIAGLEPAIRRLAQLV